MALKDVLKAGPPVTRRSDKVAAWRETLDDETRAAFDAAVADPAWGSATLARMLTQSGFKVADDTIRSYRERVA